MERIIYSQVMNHLSNNNILCDNQHGFRKFRSCESQLITTVEDLAKNMDTGGQTDMVLLDFSKAFDKVNHINLIKMFTKDHTSCICPYVPTRHILNNKFQIQANF